MVAVVKLLPGLGVAAEVLAVASDLSARPFSWVRTTEAWQPPRPGESAE
jgi:hypothetical protein